MKLEVPETFEDVAVDFSAEEWKMLTNQEKELHREVMVQNYKHMVSVGYNIPMEQLLVLLIKPDELSCAVTEEGMNVLQMENSDFSPTGI
ncbi:putative zinc finger protein 705E isoform X3 [Protopterus annectens]|uniref:putative zinc finger protein 705E isoform X3 n=1 Tax=Protopterus annectens TaxID=7888 RepID=UPI001CFAB98E|nr:putative zinc finger protein 705E isoform X3 [Protopterus annectens]